MNLNLINEKGFTLIELIMVIVIFGLLATIAIPKFINLTDQANEGKCAQNRGAIALAVSMVYSAIVVEDPSQVDWLESVTISDLHDSMFATGSIPVCPTVGTYNLNSGNVICSSHGS